MNLSQFLKAVLAKITPITTEFVVRDGAKMPMRGTKYSAGYDFFAKEDMTINPGDTVMFDSGVQAKLKGRQYLALHIRSSLGARGLILANCTGIIDADYYNTGHTIKGILWNTSKKAIEIRKGERYMQGIISRYYILDRDNVAPVIRLGGLGSTSK